MKQADFRLIGVHLRSSAAIKTCVEQAQDWLPVT
jgi:hypothetical protein